MSIFHQRPGSRLRRRRSTKRTALDFTCLAAEVLESRILLSGITQITTGEGNVFPTISSDGMKIAFQSTADLTGGNPDGNNEIFLFDDATSTFTQITNTIGGLNFNASISGNGTRIAFNSNRDLIGGNSDENEEIFLYDTVQGVFLQLTNTTGNVVFSPPSINFDGTLIALHSFENLTGNNPDRNSEIFLIDTAAGSTTQVTDTINPFPGVPFNLDPSINADGTKIAFFSAADLTGGNPDGNTEIFLFDTINSTFTQITDTAGEVNWSPSINADGTIIAFQSSRDLVGNNSDGNEEIFSFDTLTSTFTQITNTVGGANLSPSISGDGTKIGFESTLNLTGGNPDGNQEIFLYDSVSGRTVQVTDSTGTFSLSTSVSADGTRIAFNSAGDFTGDNPDRQSQIFLFDLLQTLDFGDAPDSYATTLDSNGAVHGFFGTVRLGATRDSEVDAQLPLDGTGDDANDTGSPDDEDGVRFSHFGTFDAGSTGQATVDVRGSNGTARLYAWVDFNGNGSFADVGEQIADGTGVFANLPSGLFQFQFSVTDTGYRGTTYSRFRISTDEGLGFDGPAIDGEVEDYTVEIVEEILSPAFDLAGFKPADNTFIVAATTGAFPGSLGPSEVIAALPADREFAFSTEGNFNGDGRPDFAAFGNDPVNGDGEWWVALSDGLGGYDVQQWADGLMAASLWQEFFVGDFNNDDANDIAGFSKGYFINPNDASQGFVPGQWWVFTADPNTPQFIVGGTPWADGWAIAGVWRSLFIGDFNGDSLDDVGGYSNGLFGADSAEIYVALNNGNGSESTLAWASGLPNRDRVAEVLVGNFGGEDRDDIAIFRSDGTGDASFLPDTPDAGWLVARFNGTAGFNVEVWSDIWSISAVWNGFFVGDFNSDGVDDIAGYAVLTVQDQRVGSLHVGASEATGQNPDRRFASTQWEDGLPDPNPRQATVVGDFNGDEVDDLAHLFIDGRIFISERVANGTFGTNYWGDLDVGGLDSLFAAELNA